MKMIAHTDYTKIQFPYTIAALLLVLLTSTHVCSQNRTDVSLFVKKHPEKQLEFIQ